MNGWLTPTASNISSPVIARVTVIPGELMQFISGALLLLADDENWEQSESGVTPSEAAELFGDFLEAWYESE